MYIVLIIHKTIGLDKLLFSLQKKKKKILIFYFSMKTCVFIRGTSNDYPQHMLFLKKYQKNINSFQLKKKVPCLEL